MINAQLQFKTIHDQLARFQDRLLSVEIGHLPSGEGEIAVFEGMHVQRVEQIDSDERSFSGSGTKMFLFAQRKRCKRLITVYEQLLRCGPLRRRRYPPRAGWHGAESVGHRGPEARRRRSERAAPGP